ncbi:MAG TPA: MBL fold metallo-hydrolase [Micromonosporaceae bacterium]
MAPSPVSEIAPGVFRVEDTCHVYVVRAETPEPNGERIAFAVDFGSGLALDHLPEMGVDRITDVLMTHHHRDQGQGLPRAVAAGIRIHVPPVEQDLFAHVDEMWLTRPLYNDYNLRQDKFSLLEPVPVDDVVPEYRTRTYAGTQVEVVPTPGHTTGSVTYLVERDGRRIAFTGDLIYAPGKVWSLAATQWSYTENEGPAMTVLSCLILMDRELDLLLPSHGAPIEDPRAALDLLAGRMNRYVDSRRSYPWDLRSRLTDPFTPVTEHLLLNRTSMACSYVLLSRTGAAMVIDYGYDMMTGLPAGVDRASRRPWLASLPALRKRYGVTAIEVALPTHYHDDHVAGMNLLRDVEGTEVWAPANVAPILANPLVQDLPCIWYDPIPVDRELPVGETFTWHEYEITVHELPGHTLYAAAFEFVVDGVKVLVTGDQQEGLGVPGERRDILNYQYRNLFRINDFRASAALYRRVAPGVMVSGHWKPRWVDDAFLDMLEQEGEDVVEIHHDLLPLDELDLGADGVLARITPYYSKARTGSRVRFTVSVRNPKAVEQKAWVRLVLPVGWVAEPSPAVLSLPPSGQQEIEIEVTVGGAARRRARVAIDVRIGDLYLGQHAEALVDVTGA